MSSYVACPHALSEIRWRNRKIGMLGRQCLDCGDAVSTNWIKHEDAVVELKLRSRQQLTDLADWAEIAETRDDRTLDLFSLDSAPRPERKIDRAEYDEYLNSEAWQRRRAKIMRRANGICEGCLTEPARDVHHKTYKHFKQEFAFELVALCRGCHDRVHERAA